MRVLRVTLFQRKLNGSIDLVVAKKLSQLRTDFLLFPEFYYATENTSDYSELATNGTYALQWLKKLSETQKSVIIGGTMLRNNSAAGSAEKSTGKPTISVPILYEGDLINWYDKQELSPAEKKVAKVGKDLSVEMLKNFRFSILCGREYENEDYIEKCVQNKVCIIFLISNSPSSENIEETYQKIEGYAKKYPICFIRCSGTGSLLDTQILGRSFACLKSGISWKVAKSDTSSEIIQTVILNI